MNTNTYTPSKELLSVVLGFKIDCIFISGQAATDISEFWRQANMLAQGATK